MPGWLQNGCARMYGSSRMVLTSLVAVCILLVAPRADAQAPAAGALPTAIAAHITELGTEQSPSIRDNAISSFELIERFYTQRQFEPAWSDAAKAQALIDAVRDSGEDGLTP